MIQNQKVYQQIAELQRDRMGPIMQLVKRIIIESDQEKQFYQENVLKEFL
jgi:hypothetical protein